jgi:hypothetical protein
MRIEVEIRDLYREGGQHNDDVKQWGKERKRTKQTLNHANVAPTAQNQKTCLRASAYASLAATRRW